MRLAHTIARMSNTLQDNGDGFTLEQGQLSDRMIESYASFAKSGAPLGQSPWLPYDPNVDAVQQLAPAAIALTTTFASDHQCEFWANLRGI